MCTKCLIFPQKKSYFTTRRANGVAGCLGVLMISINSGFFITAQLTSDQRVCLDAHNNRESDKIFVAAASYLTIIVPAIILFIIIFLITLELEKSQHRRRKTFMIASSSVKSPAKLANVSNNVENLMRRKLREQAHTEMTFTMMLLISALFFVIMSFPLILFTLELLPDSYMRVGPGASLRQQMRYTLFWVVAKGLDTFSHTTNFFIYFLSARKFRESLKRMFKPRYRPERNLTYRNTQTTKGEHSMPMTTLNE